MGETSRADETRLTIIRPGKLQRAFGTSIIYRRMRLNLLIISKQAERGARC
jgi:hypothetical protein